MRPIFAWFIKILKKKIVLVISIKIFLGIENKLIFMAGIHVLQYY